MIQRIQSIWLFLAAVAAFFTLKFSFFSGNMLGPDAVTKTFTYLTATSKLGILICTIAVGVAALISVFLYKNRKLQIRVTLAAMLLSLLTILLYYNETRHFAEGNYDLTALIALSIPLFFILALRGIYKDQKLVKSLDRLR
ncbi:MAG: DUF4293 domain-containing protein [Chitinophagaceae bacterium]